MSIEVTVRSHLRGDLAAHMERLLSGELRSLPGVTIQEHGPVDHEVFFGGGVLLPEGYRDPTFVLVVVAAMTPRPEVFESWIPELLPAEDRARLMARLSARRLRYHGVECRVPARSNSACRDAVQRLDDVSLKSVRLTRSDR